MEELQVTLVRAYDWTMFGDQMRLYDVDDLECLEIVVIGFLVREDDDYICLAQQLFNEEMPNIRFVVMIPKVCIVERKDLTFFPEEGESDDS
jgi:hypothetical protein